MYGGREVNVKLLLALGLCVGLAFTMRDTITSGAGLLLGRAEAINSVDASQPVEQERHEEAELTRWEIESNERIESWRTCDFKDEENPDGC
jgi:hypothetical protein